MRPEGVALACSAFLILTSVSFAAAESGAGLDAELQLIAGRLPSQAKDALSRIDGTPRKLLAALGVPASR